MVEKISGYSLGVEVTVHKVNDILASEEYAKRRERMGQKNIFSGIDRDEILNMLYQAASKVGYDLKKKRPYLSELFFNFSLYYNEISNQSLYWYPREKSLGANGLCTMSPLIPEQIAKGLVDDDKSFSGNENIYLDWKTGDLLIGWKDQIANFPEPEGNLGRFPLSRLISFCRKKYHSDDDHPVKKFPKDLNKELAKNGFRYEPFDCDFPGLENSFTFIGEYCEISIIINFNTLYIDEIEEEEKHPTMTMVREYVDAQLLTLHKIQKNNLFWQAVIWGLIVLGISKLL
jgi:hypothetical protein